MIKRATMLTSSEVSVTTDGTATFTERFRDAKIMIFIRIGLFTFMVGGCAAIGMAAGDASPPSTIDRYFPYFAFLTWAVLVAFDIWSSTAMPRWTEAKLIEHNKKMIEKATTEV
jgi:hypothetical protein